MNATELLAVLFPEGHAVAIDGDFDFPLGMDPRR